MDATTKSKLAIVLGIVILLVDLLWVYSSFPHYTGMPYSGSYNGTYQTAHNFSGSGFAGRARGYSFGIVYGAVILVADIIWLYLEFSGFKSSAKASAKKK